MVNADVPEGTDCGPAANFCQLHLDVGRQLEVAIISNREMSMDFSKALEQVHNCLHLDACFLLITTEDHPDRLRVHTSTADKITPFLDVEFDAERGLVQEVKHSQVMRWRSLDRQAFPNDRLWELLWQAMKLGPYPGRWNVGAIALREDDNDIAGILILAGCSPMCPWDEAFSDTIKLLAHQFFVATRCDQAQRNAERAQQHGESELMSALLHGGQAAVMHGVFAPLQSIELYVELARQSLRRDPRMVHGYLDSIRAMGAEVASVVRNFLLLAQSSDMTTPRGKQTLPKADWVDAVKSIVEAQVKLVPLGRLTGKSLVVRTDRPEKFPMTRAAFDEVLVNLIHNAIKYGFPGTKVKVRFHHSQHHVNLDVTSYGIAIRREDRERVFDLGFRTREAIAMHFNAVGLGLYQSRKLAEREGAELYLLDSEAMDKTGIADDERIDQQFQQGPPRFPMYRNTFRLRAKR